MSAEQPEMPQDLQQFQRLEAVKYSNGANHVYGVDEQGKKTHLKGDDVMAAYGYAGEEQGPRPTDPSQGTENPGDPSNTTDGGEDGGGDGGDGGDGEHPEPVNPEIPLDPDLAERLETARTRFVELSARRRGLIFGRRNRKELAEAKAEYDAIRDEAGAFVAGEMIARGTSPEEIHLRGIEGAVWELHDVTQQIYDAQIEQSANKRLSVFYNWWARQRGAKGFAAKVAAMGLPGTVVGFAAGAAGVALAGPFVGALIAGGAARGIARGLMGAKVNKEADAARVAGEQRDFLRRNSTLDLTRRGFADGEVLDNNALTEGIMDQTESHRKRNRNRMVGSVAIGAVAGGVGGYVASHIFGGGGGGTPRPRVPRGGGNPTPPVGPNVPTQPPELVPTSGDLPWNYMNGLLHTNNSTPAIFDIVRKGHEYGVNLVGRGRGIESITFNGQTFTDNAHINGALKMITERWLHDIAEQQRV